MQISINNLNSKKLQLKKNTQYLPFILPIKSAKWKMRWIANLTRLNEDIKGYWFQGSSKSRFTSFTSYKPSLTAAKISDISIFDCFPKMWHGNHIHFQIVLKEFPVHLSSLDLFWPRYYLTLFLLKYRDHIAHWADFWWTSENPR